MMLRRAIVLSLSLATVSPAFAAPPPKPAPAKTAPQKPVPQIDVEKTGAIHSLAVFLDCAHYGSDVTGARGWIVQSGLKEAPADIAKPFLMGKPGKVYGGSTDTGDLVIASRDNGSCSVFVGHADGNGLINAFELWLKQNNFTFKAPKTIKHKGKGGFETISRDYAIKGEGGRWHAVFTLAEPGKARFEAIMTAYHNGKS
ncbi:MAG TPA: hypothetical protein VGH02_16840 [Rhizomicrobium sp.]|jgi:hypothetical protein